ncbi:MAG: hypothetical protein HETSPECPRED_002810 [Heterodermia speciosa]|uniref:Uncharacterized protein n=1 Tax=Heterodermia speciosa TaxID=116794 RepID=A0A8H3F0X2_9LECA|nr:MAG: hypothetical protein HETSPECPRED_002810 [Heterodermia speciosa]
MVLYPTLQLPSPSVPGPVEPRISLAIGFHHDKQDVVQWQQRNRHQLVQDLAQLGIRYHQRSNECARLRGEANNEQRARGLPLVPIFPLDNIRATQLTEICECLGWEGDGKFMDVNEGLQQATMALQTRLAHSAIEGVLTQQRLIGALMLLTSLMEGLEAERLALVYKMFLPNGTWDRTQTVIRYVLQNLAQNS